MRPISFGVPETTPPVGAVLSSADLRVRVDRETAQGVFTLVGDVLRPGINRVALVSGATLIEGSASGRPLPLSADGADIQEIEDSEEGQD